MKCEHLVKYLIYKIGNGQLTFTGVTVYDPRFHDFSLMTTDINKASPILYTTLHIPKEDLLYLSAYRIFSKDLKQKVIEEENGKRTIKLLVSIIVILLLFGLYTGLILFSPYTTYNEGPYLFFNVAFAIMSILALLVFMENSKSDIHITNSDIIRRIIKCIDRGK